MSDAALPRWSAPLIGILVGGAIGSQGPPLQGLGGRIGSLAIGAALGLLAGSLVWIIDKPRAGHQSSSNQTQELFSQETSTSSNRYELLFGLILAVLSICLFWMPFIGLVISIAAFLVNYRIGGLALFLSFVALALSLILMGVVVVLAAFPRLLG